VVVPDLDQAPPATVGKPLDAAIPEKFSVYGIAIWPIVRFVKKIPKTSVKISVDLQKLFDKFINSLLVH
jgi:hypothetical protein